MADISAGAKWLIRIHAEEKKNKPQNEKNPQARNRLQLLIVESHRTRNREKAEGHKAALRPRRGTREGERNTDAFQEQPVCWILSMM